MIPYQEYEKAVYDWLLWVWCMIKFIPSGCALPQAKGPLHPGNF